MSSNAEKHESRNPILRAMIGNFHREVAHLVRRARPRSVLDLGCGEGYVLDALVRSGVADELKIALSGADLSQRAVGRARARLGGRASLHCGDATQMKFDRSFDLVMMLEVLEHLEQPAMMLDRLDQLTTRHVILSVPWEPYFRGMNLMRGRYVRRLGNHPEHIQNWTRNGFLDFVQQRFDVLVHRPQAFPWTLVLAERRT